jgi:hypothetical protein
MVAKSCGSAQINSRKITDELIDTYLSLCPDKKDIKMSEFIACERLLKYTSEEHDRQIIKKEIAELKMTLDLLS